MRYPEEGLIDALLSVGDAPYTVTDCSAAIRRFTTGKMLPCHALDTGNFVTFP